MNGGPPEANMWAACTNLLARAHIQALSVNWARSSGTKWWATCVDGNGNRVTEYGLGPAMALAAVTERIAATLRCECGRTIAISDRSPQGCRWRLDGRRFVSAHLNGRSETRP